MKTSFLIGSLSLGLLLSGCGQKASAPAAAAEAPKAEAPKTEVPAGPRVVEITANDQMKYSLATIEAKAGEQLKVVMTNIGTLPKEAMGHNWVLLKAGNDGTAFAAAAIGAAQTDYIPASLQDQVIASIGILGPRKSGEVTFTAPAPGEYVFLCSFPAHFMVGMKGKLIVR